MVGVAPPARPAPSAEIRELGAAGLAMARRGEARKEGHRRRRHHRLQSVSAHLSAAGENATRIAKPGRAHTVAGRRSARRCFSTWATPAPCVDAPFVELHERHSTAVFPMSNGAPPAASGTT